MVVLGRAWIRGDVQIKIRMLFVIFAQINFPLWFACLGGVARFSFTIDFFLFSSLLFFILTQLPLLLYLAQSAPQRADGIAVLLDGLLVTTVCCCWLQDGDAIGQCNRSPNGLVRLKWSLRQGGDEIACRVGGPTHRLIQ